MEKKLKTSSPGRRCQFPNCGRLLSIYNHHPYCRIHWELIQAADKNKPYQHPHR